MEAERRNIVNELLENDKLIEYNEKAGSVDCQIGSSSAWLVVQRLFDFVCWMAAATTVWVTGEERGGQALDSFMRNVSTQRKISKLINEIKLRRMHHWIRMKEEEINPKK